VADTGNAGHGFADLVVALRGQTFLVEVKRAGPPSAQKLRDTQTKFRANWKGRYIVAVSLQDALDQLNALMGIG